MKIVATTLGIIIAFAILSTSAVMYTGIFNVAATWEDPPLVRWVLVATRESSIERHSQDVQTPPLNDISRIENGFRSYREMCAICHTPPGGETSPLTKGLNPEPPDLAEDEDDMSDAAVFWVIKNGIRMTGMPAWGVSHSDKELWDIVAFVKTLEGMTPEDYRALDRRLSPGHGHDNNAPSHPAQDNDDMHGH